MFACSLVDDRRNTPVGILLCRSFLFQLRIFLFSGSLFSQFLITLAHYGREHSIPVRSLQLPVLFRHEILYLLLSFHDKSQCRSLHAPDGQHLFVLSVFQSIKSCGIHSERPVAYRTAESRLIQRLEFRLVLQVCKSLSDSLFRKRRNPQTLHRTFRPRLLHHPSLYQFTLLSGITAVYNHIRLLHQRFYYLELLLYTRVVYQLYPEARRYHRQTCQRPRFPLRSIFVRLFQRTQVSECPCHLISVSFYETILLVVCAKHFRYISCHTGLFGYANYHSLSV